MRITNESQNCSCQFREKRNVFVIVSTWRSGSSFTCDIFDSHPDVYLHYEPLQPFGLQTFYEENPSTRRVQEMIFQLSKCRYNDLYLNKTKSHRLTLVRNKKLLTFCENNGLRNRSVCFQRKNLEMNCRFYKWNVIKLVRLGLRFLKPLLEDETLNTYVLLLVRDPRATMNSRRTSISFCNEKTCFDTNVFCSNLKDDVKTYNDYIKIFKGRLILLRYEDLCLDPFGVVEKLFKTINLSFLKSVTDFLLTHTTTKKTLPMSTVRNSKEQLIDWTREMNIPLLNEVQNSCSFVMDQLGYKVVSSLTNVSIRNVLTDLNIHR